MVNITYENNGNKVSLFDFNSFRVDEILECGQCFRFEKISNMHYEVVAFGKVLNIEQFPDKIEFYPCTKEEFENIWIDYFDLERDYETIKNVLYENDIVIRDAIEYAGGIRILNQDIFETIISFIISQNNRIPQIKQVIKNLSKKYGSQIDENNYAFPTPSELLMADEDGLRECKAGFRAKYIMDAVHKINDGSVNINKNSDAETSEIKKDLMEIKGIGNKVADCVLLFGFSRHEYFPIDVWVKRIMQHFYFDGKETSLEDMQNFAANQFGEYAGFAQQYLFHYARQFPELFK